MKAQFDKLSGMMGQGDGRKALDLFLSEYKDHPLGNPWADEARRVFEAGQESRRKAHKAEVERAWKDVMSLAESDQKQGIEAVGLFLGRFSGHELGNHLESEAKRVLSRLKRGESVGGGMSGKKGKRQRQGLLCGQGKTRDSNICRGKPRDVRGCCIRLKRGESVGGGMSGKKDAGVTRSDFNLLKLRVKRARSRSQRCSAVTKIYDRLKNNPANPYYVQAKTLHEKYCR